MAVELAEHPEVDLHLALELVERGCQPDLAAPNTSLSLGRRNKAECGAMSGLVAAFPSPSTGTIEIGPLSIHMYGITLLVAIVARSWSRASVGRVAAATGISSCGPPSGASPPASSARGSTTSSRATTSCRTSGGAPSRCGREASASGAASSSASSPAASSSGAPDRASRLFADCLAPGLLLAQAVGRWGNWWNQELYGKPTDLPWGLDIDAEHCPVEYLDLATGCTENFHPIFLYEFVFNLVGVGLLLLVERLVRIRSAGALRSLHLVVHGWTALRGAAAHRSFARAPRPAAELLGCGRALRLLDGVLHLVAVLPQAPRARPERLSLGIAAGGSGYGRPQGTRPPASLASRGCLHPCWTSTSTRSRARSTCC